MIQKRAINDGSVPVSTQKKMKSQRVRAAPVNQLPQHTVVANYTNNATLMSHENSVGNTIIHEQIMANRANKSNTSRGIAFGMKGSA